MECGQQLAKTGPKETTSEMTGGLRDILPHLVKKFWLTVPSVKESN
jgi:hypothetical protein